MKLFSTERAEQIRKHHPLNVTDTIASEIGYQIRAAEWDERQKWQPRLDETRAALQVALEELAKCKEERGLLVDANGKLGAQLMEHSDKCILLGEQLAAALEELARVKQERDEAIKSANIQCEIRYSELARAEKAEQAVALKAENSRLRAALKPLEQYGDPADLADTLEAIYRLMGDGQFPYEGEESLDRLVEHKCVLLALRGSRIAEIEAENSRLREVVKAADRVHLELEWLLEMSRPCIGNTNVEVVRHWVGVYEKAKAALAGEVKG